MRILESHEGNKIKFIVSVSSRSRSKKMYAYKSDIIKTLKQKYDLENCVFLDKLSDGDLTKWVSKGCYVFEKKIIDNPVNYVKMDTPIVEAELPSLVDEEKPKKENASLSSEKLPIGLKKVKKKRTTRKKKTEE